ncbi:MAG: 1-acyl-sn-glycerol-3-phosphate acyltransferase [Armatimonadetes bacterium]|nr:1-acyl-sn-glycerol-3-phosphate acyltransferase [Armatimonadota bacterium]
MPRKGALLVISNHISNTDPVAVQFACPRILHFLARKELFEMKGIGFFLRWFRSVPIKQSSADRGAIRTAVELLKEGRPVCIFPEGQLSPDGRLVEVLPGAALIVRMSEAPCICVGIKNTNKMMPDPKTTPQWAFAVVRARWGEVRKFSKDVDPSEVVNWIESELKRLSGQ